MTFLRAARWVLTVLLIGCGKRAPVTALHLVPSQGERPTIAGTWATKLDRDHRLVGKIWNVGQRRFVAPAELATALSGTQMLLLGEKHDNPDHHRLQARLFGAFADKHPRAAVAFEMFDVAQQATIDAYRRSPIANAEGLGPALAWEKSGWPPWNTYAPIADVAMARGLTILGANLSTERARAVAHGGISALDEQTVKVLELDRPFPPELEAPLLAELRVSHCGHLPDAVLPRMAAAQHARDAQMARIVVQSADDGVVLIAGRGHVRKDTGVPFFVKRATQARAQETPTEARRGAVLTSVAFVEVQTELTEPEGYRDGSGDVLPFDFVWFTPRATDDDPCAPFRK